MVNEDNSRDITKVWQIEWAAEWEEIRQWFLRNVRHLDRCYLIPDN